MTFTLGRGEIDDMVNLWLQKRFKASPEGFSGAYTVSRVTDWCIMEIGDKGTENEEPMLTIDIDYTSGKTCGCS